MPERATWCYQDTLKISANKWCEFLQNPSFFDDNVLKMVLFVYSQTDHRSTVSDIAAGLMESYNQITAWNRKISKRLYEYFDVEPPANSKKMKRYWNVVFDGDPECPRDKNGHFYWILRPNLVEAIESTLLIK